MRAAPPTNKTSRHSTEALSLPGVAAKRIYVDHGLTGTTREAKTSERPEAGASEADRSS